MSEKHTIRNGLIITVAGGLILATCLSFWMREIIGAWVSWLWSIVATLGSFFAQSFPVPVWLISLLALLAMYPLIRIARRHTREEEHPEYTQDELFGAVWRWHMVGGHIYDLMACCPRCDSELVYDEQMSDDALHAVFTQFVCERCSIRSDKVPGDRRNATARVEREIRRKLRTGEWKRERGIEPMK